MRSLFLVACALTVHRMMNPGELCAGEPIVGHWLEHSPNSQIRMDEKVQGAFGGWQTSDLTFDVHTKTWWSIGDQNCRENAEYLTNRSQHRGRYVYRLTHANHQFQAEPIQIWWERKDPEFTTVDASFHSAGTGYIDFEGIAADPTQPNRLFACTEGPEPWLVEMQYHEDQRTMKVTRTVRISTQGNHDRNTLGQAITTDLINKLELFNKRWEGIAISPDGRTIFLATEWVDSPARIYSVPMSEFRKGEWTRENGGKWIPPKVLPVPFETTGLEGELTGLCFGTHSGRTCLVVLERNTPDKKLPPSLYLIDMASPKSPARRIALDLRAPALDHRKQGIQIGSASPEGVAIDGEGRVVLISDPVGTFYRTQETGGDEVKIRNLIPLVFSTQISNVWP